MIRGLGGFVQKLLETRFALSPPPAHAGSGRLPHHADDALHQPLNECCTGRSAPSALEFARSPRDERAMLSAIKFFLLGTVVIVGSTVPRTGVQAQVTDAATLAAPLAQVLLDSALPANPGRKPIVWQQGSASLDYEVARRLSVYPRLRGPLRGGMRDEWMYIRSVVMDGDSASVVVEVGNVYAPERQSLSWGAQWTEYVFRRRGTQWEFLRRRVVRDIDGGFVSG
jgi:hypothetical protein